MPSLRPYLATQCAADILPSGASLHGYERRRRRLRCRKRHTVHSAAGSERYELKRRRCSRRRCCSETPSAPLPSSCVSGLPDAPCRSEGWGGGDRGLVTGARLFGCGYGTNRTHLWAGTADLTHVAVVDLRRFGRLLGPQLFTLKRGLLGERVARPGGGRCDGRHRLLLLLLLLLVVAGGSGVNGRLVTRIRGS